MFFVFEIIAFQPFPLLSTIFDENTCDMESTCYQKLRRFQILLRELFSNSICPRLMENLYESVLVEVPAVFGSSEQVY